MAEFVHQYVGELLKRQHALAEAYPDVVGTDIMSSTRQLYNINLMNLMIMGVIMKVISDLSPVVTDQVWIDRLDQAIDSSLQDPWPDWIVNQDSSGL